MKMMRRLLGVFVMITGILGLLLSLAGLATVWIIKPTVTTYANTTIDTLNRSVITSRSVMQTTAEALGATVDSVDALSTMLSTTAVTVEDTKPVLDKINTIMAFTLPSTLEATTTSLYTAQEAAQVLESAIQSLEAFRFLLSGVPLVGSFVEQPEESYSPEVPLADSLGKLAANLEGLPATFVEMADDLSATDGNLGTIKENLITMADSVGLISSSLSEYQSMVIQSQASMDEVTSILTNIQSNLATILHWVAIALTSFFVWLLMAQIVIFSQGLELYHGTTDRMDGKN